MAKKTQNDEAQIPTWARFFVNVGQRVSEAGPIGAALQGEGLLVKAAVDTAKQKIQESTQEKKGGSQKKGK